MSMIPDTPHDVKVQIHRENLLEQQIMFEENNENDGHNNEKLHQDPSTDCETTITASEVPPLAADGGTNTPTQ